MKNLISKSFINASGVFIYVSIIAYFLSVANDIFGVKDTAITPIFVLLLLIISATITGSLVLGKPILLYIDGFKKEALKMFLYTIGFLIIFLIIIAIIMAVSTKL